MVGKLAAAFSVMCSCSQTGCCASDGQQQLSHLISSRFIVENVTTLERIGDDLPGRERFSAIKQDLKDKQVF